MPCLLKSEQSVALASDHLADSKFKSPASALTKASTYIRRNMEKPHHGKPFRSSATTASETILRQPGFRKPSKPSPWDQGNWVKAFRSCSLRVWRA